MKRLVLVPVALVVFVLLSLVPEHTGLLGRTGRLFGQAGLNTRLSVSLYAQDASAATPDRGPSGSAESFEVASVKENKSGNGFATMRPEGNNQFNITNVPLREIIDVAYQLQPFQVVGGPDWIASVRFDILAKAPAGVALRGGPQGPLPAMLRTLLADRFKLQAHMETRDMPEYALVLARSDGKLGPKLERAAADCGARGRGAGRAGEPPQPPPPLRPGERPGCGMMMMSPASIATGGAPMSQLAQQLSRAVRRIVTDRTGLEGNWSFDVSFAPDLSGGLGPVGPGGPPPADPNAPSLFTALQEQLGLKLESTHGLVDVLVIDNVDHPTED